MEQRHQTQIQTEEHAQAQDQDQGQDQDQDHDHDQDQNQDLTQTQSPRSKDYSDSKSIHKSVGNKKKKTQRKQDSTNNNNHRDNINTNFGNSSSASAGSSSSSSATASSLPPLPFPPEFAARCLNAATVSGSNMAMNMKSSGGASVTITKGRMFGPSPPPTSKSSKSNNSFPNSSSSGDSSSKNTQNSNSNSNTTNIDLAALAQSGGISLADLGIDISSASGSNNPNTRTNSDSSSQPAAAPCSEAEMKALMSMFVEFMGFFSDQDNLNRPNNTNNPDEPIINTTTFSSSNPNLSKENFIRMNAAALAASQARNNSSAFSNLSKSAMNATKGGTSTGSSSPFPVFSMLFGAGAGATSENEGDGVDSTDQTNNNISSNKSTDSRSAPQAHPVSSSGHTYNDETNSDWIDYYEDKDDDAIRDASIDEAEKVDRISLDDDNDEVDEDEDDEEDEEDIIDPSMENVIRESHGHIQQLEAGKERLVHWSNKVHADIMSVRENRSSPFRHKRTKQPRQFETKLQYMKSPASKGNRHRGNKTVNSSSFIMANEKYTVNTLTGRINALHKATKMGIDWETMKEMNKEFGDNALGDLDIDHHFYGSVEEDSSSEQNSNHANSAQTFHQANDSNHDDMMQMAEEEEKAIKAAKKREKKNRKREKARREASLKAAKSAQRRREAKITSWRSRVATACSNGEITKLETLLGDSPFKNYERHGIIQNISERQDISTKKDTTDEDASDITGEYGSLNEYSNDDVNQHMEWLLHACFPKYDQKPSKRELEAKYKLSTYVMKIAYEIFFQPVRNGRNLLHVAAQMGDTNFIKHVMEHIENKSDTNSEDQKNIFSYLYTRCEDSGWSALHYATAHGWIEIIEILLAGGFDIKTATDPILTRRLNDGNGITARELLETIQSDKPLSLVECKGNALEKAIKNNSNLNETDSDKSTNQMDLGSIISRLLHIEQNGYSNCEKSHQPKQCAKSDESSTIQTQSAQPSSMKSKIKETKSSGEDSKKKKKKKKKSQQQQSSNSENINSDAQTKTAKETEDPLISALLSMGFTSSQISAAAKACGGTENATADMLVAWIFENESGETNDSQNNDESLDLMKSQEAASDYESDMDKMKGTNAPKSSKRTESQSTNEPLRDHATMLKAQHQQRMADLAAAQVMREEEEAAEREREAKAAAQRRAAKREEQRRINREWNNREQVRQKEEAQAKFLEKRRVAKAGKTKEAQRVERSQIYNPHAPTTTTNNPAIVRMAHHQQIPHHNAVLSSSINGISHHTPHFPSTNIPHHTLPTPYDGVSGNTSTVDYNHYDAHSSTIQQINNNAPSHSNKGRRNRNHNQSHGRNPYPNQVLSRQSPPSYIVDHSSIEYSNTPVIQQGRVLPVYVDSVGYQVDNFGSSSMPRDNFDHQQRKKSSKHGPPPQLEVNAFDFPELGKEKATKAVKGKGNQNKSAPMSNSSGGNGGRKSTKGKGKFAKQKNSHSPANMKRPMSRSPPPGFKSSQNPAYSDASSTPKKNFVESAEVKVEDEPNQLGEIRATAKEFVPTFFKPPPVETGKREVVASIVAKSPTVMAEKEHLNVTSQPSLPPFRLPTLMQPSSSLQNKDSFNANMGKNTSSYDATAALLAPAVNSLLNSSGQSDEGHLLPSGSFPSRSNSAPSSSPHSPIHSSASSITGSGVNGGDELGGSNNLMLIGNHISASGNTGSILESIPLGRPLANSSSNLGNISVSVTNSIWGDGSNSSSGIGGFSPFSIGVGSNIGSNQTESGTINNLPGFGSENKANEDNNVVAGGWGSGNVLNGSGSGGLSSIW